MVVKLEKEHAVNLLAELERIKGDDEVAHSAEDWLRDWFIECCANGLYTKKEMIEIGKIVHSTKDVKFGRWYA
jgi:hypothetical protein